MLGRTSPSTNSPRVYSGQPKQKSKWKNINLQKYPYGRQFEFEERFIERRERLFENDELFFKKNVRISFKHYANAWRPCWPPLKLKTFLVKYVDLFVLIFEFNKTRRPEDACWCDIIPASWGCRPSPSWHAYGRTDQVICKGRFARA